MQHRQLLRVVERQVLKHAVQMLTDLRGTEAWPDFYSTYSRELRMGVHDCEPHRESLAALCEWPTLLDPGGAPVALRDHAKGGEGPLYYATGEGSPDEVIRSPFLEALAARGAACLLLTEPIDEYVSLRLTSFCNRQLVWAEAEPG